MVGGSGEVGALREESVISGVVPYLILLACGAYIWSMRVGVMWPLELVWCEVKSLPAPS